MIRCLVSSALVTVLVAMTSLLVSAPARAMPVDNDCNRLCRQRVGECRRACPRGRDGRDCRAACRESGRACLEEAGVDSDGDGVGDACEQWDLVVSMDDGGAGSMVAGAQVGIEFPPETLSIDEEDVSPLPLLDPVLLMSVNATVPGQVRAAAVKAVGDDFPLPSDLYLMVFEADGRHPDLSDFVVFDCLATDSAGSAVPGECLLDLMPRLPGF